MTNRLSDSQTNSAKFVLKLFLSFSLISFIYCLSTGSYNGDFLGTPVELPVELLIVNLGINILPYWILWRIFLYFEKREVKRKINVSIAKFGYFISVIFLWHILVTIFFGVGIMGAESYNAPTLIKPFIQLMNRFNYVYGGLIFIAASGKKSRFQLFIVLLLLLLGYLRAGLGVTMYIILIYIIKYYDEIQLIIRKYLFMTILATFMFPVVVGFLFEIRDTLRNQEISDEDLTTVQLIFGKLVGRLSSYSNSAIILQEAPFFFLSAQQLDEFYFQKEAFAGVVSVKLMPKDRPESILYNLYAQNDNNTISYMTGTQGNLIISLFKSPAIVVLNFITIVCFIFATFYLMSLLNFSNNGQLALILLLYVVTSGVSSEYSLLFFSIFVYLITFLLLNFTKKSTKTNIL